MQKIVEYSTVTGETSDGTLVHSIIARDRSSGYVPEIGTSWLFIVRSADGKGRKERYRVKTISHSVHHTDVQSDLEMSVVRVNVHLEKMAHWQRSA